MMMANAPLSIDEVQGWPILISKGTPDDVIAIHGNRVADLHVANGPSNVVDIFFKRKLRCVDADDYEPLILVFLCPGTDIGKGAAPVDASVGPEVDEDDLAAQRLGCQWRRIKPRVRVRKRHQFGLAAAIPKRKSVEKWHPHAGGSHRLTFHVPEEAGYRRPDCDGEDRADEELVHSH